MKIYGYRKGYTLVPYKAYCGMLEKVREGDRVRIVIDSDRNGKFNSLFHVLLSKAVDAINRGPAQTSITSLKNFVKLKKGYYKIVDLPTPTPTGETTSVEFKSTSFHTMGEEEFHQFAVDTCDLIANELATWIKDSPEWGEIKQMVRSIMPPDQEGRE